MSPSPFDSVYLFPAHQGMTMGRTGTGRTGPGRTGVGTTGTGRTGPGRTETQTSDLYFNV